MRTIEKLELKKSILIGLMLTSPIVVLSSERQESISNSLVDVPSINVEEKVEKKYRKIKHLHNDGAISTGDSEKHMKDELITKPLNPKSEDAQHSQINPNIAINNNEKVQIFFSESDSLIQLELLKAKQIKKSEITKINSGWQIIMEFLGPINIDLSTLPNTTNYISKINIDRFNESTFIFKIIDNNRYRTNKPKITNDTNIKLDISLSAKKSIFNFPFFNRLNKNNSPYNQENNAVAPPLGDMAAGSVLLENRGFIKLNGPKVSLTLNNASANDALMRLSKLAGYGFVLANENSKAKSANSSGSIKGPNVTLSFVDEDYSIAFNSILLAAGLQAKKSNNIIIVGENVLGKSFGPQVSKVYRLNQASASSAADYLASLGASISKVDTISSDSNSGGGTSQNNTNSVKYIDSYSASTGPLRGLIGTTDSRLQTITLVGSSELIVIGEKYLKQLDLRQRQVALSVKILDVELSNSDSFNNDMAFRTGSTFIVNEQGKLFSAFGNFIPPTMSSANSSESRTYTQETTIDQGIKTTTNAIKSVLATSVTPNPGFQYSANELYNFLAAQIKSSSTKVLANPTLILSENTEAIKGGAEVIGDVSSTKASIGRPFANESFVTLGTNVITDYKTSTSEEGGTTTCEAEFSTAGLTFGARVNKIDDNGYVTFSLSPKLTSISEIINIPNCGPINILSVRRLDTGILRVRDSQTLILTGVISDLDSEVITKTPILGDIPILGRLFRSTAGSKRKSELIILVTPKIINDTESATSGIGYEPTVNESKKIIDESK